MAENENGLEQYKTQFTKENILSLKSAINEAVNKYAENVQENKTLDLFVILAALSQSAYEVTVRTLPENDEQAKKARDEMVVLVDRLIKETDATRKEIKNTVAAEIMATAHLLGVVSEFYSRRRDESIERLLQDEAKTDEKA